MRTTTAPVSAAVDEKKETSETIALDTPFLRGTTMIESVTLRKPHAGALRGVSLVDLANLDVTALQRVLPRISSPTLTEQDVARMDPADLLQLGGAVAGFLLPRAQRFDSLDM